MSKTLTDLSREIADRLEHDASQKCGQKTREAQIHYEAYVQACEDFGRKMREYAQQQND